jgi:hypothetical protein
MNLNKAQCQEQEYKFLIQNIIPNLAKIKKAGADLAHIIGVS